MTIDESISGTSEASPIDFRLDPNSGVPTYLQIVQQVEQALRLGYLGKGDQLPKVREVVASLAINPNTVLKAYRELETKGLTAGRPGQGTFIQATVAQAALLWTRSHSVLNRLLRKSNPFSTIAKSFTNT